MTNDLIKGTLWKIVLRFFHVGVQNAALTTVISQGMSVVLCVIHCQEIQNIAFFKKKFYNDYAYTPKHIWNCLLYGFYVPTQSLFPYYERRSNALI